jgi:pyruvate dehydrogenase E1 component beta subunit
MMKVALSAADELAKEGIEAEVVDLRTIRPLDYETIINSVKKTNRLLIIEEAWPYGNVSTEISYKVQKDAFDYLDAPIRRLNTADSSMHYAPTLVQAFLPTVEQAVKTVKELMYVSK